MIRYQWPVKIALKDAEVQYSRYSRACSTALYRLMQVAWIRKRILGIGPPYGNYSLLVTNIADASN